MTPWTALLLGLAVLAVLVTLGAGRVFLTLLAVGCFSGVLIALWFGAAAATDDLGSSWSDPGPQRLLRWAGALAVIGISALLARFWPRLWERLRRRR